MSYLDWKVGDKVVCIDADGHEERLEVGKVYTIHSLGYPWVRLIEPETWGIGGQESAGYRYRRFRKVETRKTDISIFTSMLTGTKRKVSA